ncbi:MAG: PAS domain S-box protein, partial [Candidatus Aureabacteria bacterium]|nr:PAS domain S-box protein [Candidatus Auribacterota bacterium]
YSRRDGDMLVTVAGWQVPPECAPSSRGEGHICFDVITKGLEEPVVIKNLQNSVYRETDPNVKAFLLKTYIGYPVKLRGKTVASLCAVFKTDIVPTEQQLELFQILARAAAVEEERDTAGEALERSRAELEARVEDRTRELRATIEALERGNVARKGMERALQQSDAQYRELVENANSIILKADMNGVITFMNEFVEKFFGYAKSEIIGKYLLGVIVPFSDSSGRDLSTLISDIVKSPDRYINHENENVRRNGERVWIAWTNRAIRDTNGVVVGILCIGNDITERKRADDAIRKSEEEFRLVFEESKDAIIWADPATGTVIRCNKAAEELLERRREDIIGKHQSMIHSPQKAEHYSLLFKKHVAKERFHEFEEEVITASGKIIPVSITGSVTLVGGRRIIQGVFRDISDRKRREEQLLHAQKMEAVGTLTGGIAHDFNNILAGLMGYISLMKMNIDKNGGLSADLDSVEKLLHRGASLTGKLLAFSRRGSYHAGLINLNRVIDDVFGVLRQTAGRGVDIVGDMAPDLWSVLADEGELHQVVMNVCLNACEAMPEGGTLTARTANLIHGPALQRQLPQLKKEKYISLTVADTGVGMEARDLSHIFEPFYSTKTKKSGTGLGLAVVRTIVEKLGGCITLKSTPRAGTTFTIYFPASERKEKESPGA